MDEAAARAASERWINTITESAKLIVDAGFQQMAADGEDINDPGIPDEDREIYKVGIEGGIQAGIAAAISVLGHHDAIRVDVFAEGPRP